MEKISVFSLNGTNGQYVILRDATIEDIIAELHNTFPKWNDEVLAKVANNKSFYHEVAPMVTPKKSSKQKGESRAFMKPIIVDGLELNPLLKLGKSVHSYHKNVYKQWGVCVNEIFDDWKITPYYNDFERKFEQIEKNVKANALTDIIPLSKELCTKLISLQRAIVSSGVLNDDKEKEYMNGNGRRLGLNELVTRISEIVPSFNEKF